MSSSTDVSRIIFNQMSDTKYGTLIPTEGEFYCTPDYLDLPILTYQYTDHILNDIQWLRADTYSWQSGSVYSSVYNKLVEEYNNENCVTKYAHTGIYSTNQIMNSNSKNGWVCSGSLESGAAWLAFNGDWTTTEQCWWTGESVGLPQWIQMKSPTKKFIKSVIIENETATPVSPYAGNIYGSNDGTNWTLLKSFNREASNTVSYKTTHFIDSTDLYTYVRIEVTSSSSGNSVSIQEIEIEYEDYIEYKETPCGLKIANASQEALINQSYSATKNTWFYVLDTTNTRFKLPRKHERKLIYNCTYNTNYCRIYSDGWCEQGRFVDSTLDVETRYYFIKPFLSLYTLNFQRRTTNNANPGSTTINMHHENVWSVDNNGFNSWGNWNSNTLAFWDACGYVDISNYDVDAEYLYFFVGNYSKSAIEQTAGITSEALNGKVDKQLTSPVSVTCQNGFEGNVSYFIKDGWCTVRFWHIKGGSVAQGQYPLGKTQQLPRPVGYKQYATPLCMANNGGGVGCWVYWENNDPDLKCHCYNATNNCYGTFTYPVA